MKTSYHPVCIVGAGPYGLSVAAHLRARGIPVRVFGEPLGSWRKHMPERMFLKSVARSSSLASPVPGYRLDDFCAQADVPFGGDDWPVPLELFVRYGLWFQQSLVPDVEEVQVRHVQGGPTQFDVTLESGEEVEARAVVVANGHVGYAYVPPGLRALAEDAPASTALVSHSSDHRDFSAFAGREVAVLGAGQSALETAALLREADARPYVLARCSRLVWGDPPQEARRQLKPDSMLGPGWSLYAVSRAPTAVSRLPRQSRLMLVRKILGPSGAWWLRERVDGLIDTRTGWRLETARRDDGRVVLRGRTRTNEIDELTVDHVVASTGYRVNVDSLTFLDPLLRRRLRRVAGWPALNRWSQSSVPGLFFTGLSAAATFGPLMRFVAGTSFAAPRISAALSASRA